MKNQKRQNQKRQIRKNVNRLYIVQVNNVYKKIQGGFIMELEEFKRIYRTRWSPDAVIGRDITRVFQTLERVGLVEKLTEEQAKGILFNVYDLGFSRGEDYS